MKSGELIQKVAGIPVATWQDVRWILLQQSLKTQVVEVQAPMAVPKCICII